MNVVHLTASGFLGGPERQMLELARTLRGACTSTFVSFREGGRCQEFLDQAERDGFEAIALEHDRPWLVRVVRELADLLRELATDVLLCNGYKANLLGRWAARQAGVPAAAVSRGWTAENWRVWLYEVLDRRNLRVMERVVCVSRGQAERVLRAGVPAEKVRVIHNAIRVERFDRPDPGAREELQRLFDRPKRHIVGAGGRLSPEKGFDVLIEAARRLDAPETGFVVFGEGKCRAALSRQVEAAGLAGSFVLPGHRNDLDRLLSGFDLLALPSHTEGLPNIVLEAMAAGLPVVATRVGGNPELVTEDCGRLVEPGDADDLAAALGELLASPEDRQELGRRGRERVVRDFTFAAQAERYLELFRELRPVQPRQARGEECRA